MKTLVVYTSQTGFTRKYAQWIAERTGADLFHVKDVQKKDNSFFGGYEAIVFAGWLMAEKESKVNWFLDRVSGWKDKRLAVVAVGASPIGNPQVEKALNAMLNDEQKAYIETFYCQGGLNYEKMNVAARLMMKAFANSLKNSKNEESRKMGEIFGQSCDFSDQKYIEPVLAYLQREMSA